MLLFNTWTWTSSRSCLAGDQSQRGTPTPAVINPSINWSVLLKVIKCIKEVWWMQSGKLPVDKIDLLCCVQWLIKARTRSHDININDDSHFTIFMEVNVETNHVNFGNSTDRIVYFSYKATKICQMDWLVYITNPSGKSVNCTYPRTCWFSNKSCLMEQTRP